MVESAGIKDIGRSGSQYEYIGKPQSAMAKSVSIKIKYREEFQEDITRSHIGTRCCPMIGWALGLVTNTKRITYTERFF